MQTQRGVTPFIIETINGTPSPISHLSVRPSHTHPPPPPPLKGMGHAQTHVHASRHVCAHGCILAEYICPLQHFIYLTRQLTALHVSRQIWQRPKMLDGKRAARRSPCFGMAADLSCRGRKEIPAAVWWHEFNSGSPALPLITADNLPRRDVGNVVICSAVVWPAKCC